MARKSFIVRILLPLLLVCALGAAGWYFFGRETPVSTSESASGSEVSFTTANGPPSKDKPFIVDIDTSEQFEALRTWLEEELLPRQVEVAVEGAMTLDGISWKMWLILISITFISAFAGAGIALWFFLRKLNPLPGEPLRSNPAQDHAIGIPPDDGGVGTMGRGNDFRTAEKPISQDAKPTAETSGGKDRLQVVNSGENEEGGLEPGQSADDCKLLRPRSSRRGRA